MKKLLPLVLATLACAPALAHGPRWRDPAAPSVRVGLGMFQPEGRSGFWDSTFGVYSGSIENFDDFSAGVDLGWGLSRITSLQLSGEYFDSRVSQVDLDYVDDLGNDIVHDTELALAPLTVGIVIHPFGRHQAFAPYAGFGAGFYLWRYREAGDFVVFDDGAVDGIVADDYRTHGVDPGYYVSFGADAQIGPDVRLFAEARHHNADGQPNRAFAGSDVIDLSGTTYRAGLAWSF